MSQLEHYGVKGMRWGKRKGKKDIKSTFNNAMNKLKSTSESYKEFQKTPAYVNTTNYVKRAITTAIIYNLYRRYRF